MKASTGLSITGKFGFLAMVGGIFSLGGFSARLFLPQIQSQSLARLYTAVFLILLAAILLATDPYVRSQHWGLLRIADRFTSRGVLGLLLAGAGLIGLLTFVSSASALEQGASFLETWWRLLPSLWWVELLFIAPVVIGAYMFVTDERASGSLEQK